MLNLSVEFRMETLSWVLFYSNESPLDYWIKKCYLPFCIYSYYVEIILMAYWMYWNFNSLTHCYKINSSYQGQNILTLTKSQFVDSALRGKRRYIRYIFSWNTDIIKIILVSCNNHPKLCLFIKFILLTKPLLGIITSHWYYGMI